MIEGRGRRNQTIARRTVYQQGEIPRVAGQPGRSQEKVWKIEGVCVNFTDLNKACPKNSFPLPHIDRLVDSTAVNELVTFMDVFSGYNQIMLDPNDREKTTFITDQGTYCYKVMSFSLKNASTTYQCLVNNMFAERLGITKEVNIEDMIVKSQVAADHIEHLKDCFLI